MSMLFSWLCLVVLSGLSPPADAATADLPRVFCGRVLADARVLYCYGAEQERKRDVPFQILGHESVEGNSDKGLFPYDKEESVWAWLSGRHRQVVWPWLSGRQASAQHALSMLRAKRNPGLVDECCLKACYVSELMNYC